MKRLLAKWLLGPAPPPPEPVQVEVEKVVERVILLPVGMRVTKEDYLRACARVVETPDGQILLAAYREKLIGALELMCPYREPEQRLNWLAGHEMLLAVRREMYDELELNDDLIDQVEKTPRLRGMRMHEGEDNG